MLKRGRFIFFRETSLSPFTRILLLNMLCYTDVLYHYFLTVLWMFYECSLISRWVFSVSSLSFLWVFTERFLSHSDVLWQSNISIISWSARWTCIFPKRGKKQHCASSKWSSCRSKEILNRVFHGFWLVSGEHTFVRTCANVRMIDSEHRIESSFKARFPSLWTIMSTRADGPSL